MHQFGIDDPDIAERVDITRDMHDVSILETAHDVRNRVGLTNIGKKLIAEPLALRCPGHEPRDIDEFDGRRQYLRQDFFSGEFTRPFALTQESTAFHIKKTPRSRRDSRPVRRGSSKNASKRFALLSGRWKYVYDQTEANELYDMAGQGEGFDVSSENAEVVSSLDRITREILGRTRTVTDGEASSEAEAQELLNNLRELGYVGED